MDSNPETLLLPQEVAKILKISVGALYKWRARKHPLPFIKMSHSIRYRLSDVNAFIEGRLHLREPSSRRKRRNLKRETSKSEPKA